MSDINAVNAIRYRDKITKQIFRKLDRNKNGRLELDEFIKADKDKNSKIEKTELGIDPAAQKFYSLEINRPDYYAVFSFVPYLERDLELDLVEANLEGTNLKKANLEGANLKETDLRVANLTWATLKKANLFRADLEGANLYRANLYRANLFEADLEGADLRLATLLGACFVGANLEDIKVMWWQIIRRTH